MTPAVSSRCQAAEKVQAERCQIKNSSREVQTERYHMRGSRLKRFRVKIRSERLIDEKVHNEGSG